MTQQPEWSLRDQGVSPQNAPLISLRNQCVFNFSAKKLDLALEMRSGGEALNNEDTDVFADQVEAAAGLVIEELGIKDFERIGFRAWYLFTCASPTEANAWLRSLGLFQLSGKFCEVFSQAEESVSLSVVFGGRPSYRVALNQVERTAQVDVGQEILSVRASKLPKNQREVFLEQMRVKKRLLANPDFAAMVDIDAFEDDPEVPDFKNFVKTSLAAFADKMTRATK
jgi:hypothetical protein